MKQTRNYLLQASGLYLIGDLISRGIIFLLLPIITIYITPSDYGIISLAVMLQSLVSMMLSFRGVINRFYYQHDIEERNQFLGSFWLFLILGAAAAILVIMFLGKPVLHFFFPSLPFYPFVPMILLTAYSNIAFLFVAQDYFQAKLNAKVHILISITTSIVTAIATIWLVVFQHNGAEGYLLGGLVAAGYAACISGWLLSREVRVSVNWKLVKPGILFGIPMLPHFFFHWVLGLSDRVILDHFTTLEKVGIYSLGYQFGLALQFIYAALNKSLVPIFSQAATSSKAFNSLTKISTLHVLAVSFLGLAGIILLRPLLLMLFPVEYHSAQHLLPWIILGVMFVGYYYLPMNLITMTIGKTTMAPILTFIAGAVNIGLNLYFVPKVGVMAAAYNTAIGYGVLLILMFTVSQRLRPIKYEWGRLARIYAITIALVTAGFSVMRFSSPGWNFLVGLVIVAAFPILLLISGFVKKEEYPLLKELFGSLRRK